MKLVLVKVANMYIFTGWKVNLVKWKVNFFVDLFVNSFFNTAGKSSQNPDCRKNIDEFKKEEKNSAGC